MWPNMPPAAGSVLKMVCVTACLFGSNAKPDTHTHTHTVVNAIVIPTSTNLLYNLHSSLFQSLFMGNTGFVCVCVRASVRVCIYVQGFGTVALSSPASAMLLWNQIQRGVHMTSLRASLPSRISLTHTHTHTPHLPTVLCARPYVQGRLQVENLCINHSHQMLCGVSTVWSLLSFLLINLSKHLSTSFTCIPVRYFSYIPRLKQLHVFSTTPPKISNVRVYRAVDVIHLFSRVQRSKE